MFTRITLIVPFLLAAMRAQLARAAHSGGFSISHFAGACGEGEEEEGCVFNADRSAYDEGGGGKGGVN